MTSIHRHVEELLPRSGHPRVSAAEPLCDRHPGDAVARDLSSRDRTSGVLRDRSGPSEVESVLPGHPAVVGAPDDLRGAVVAALVVLRAGRGAGTDLAGERRTRFAAPVSPRTARFVPEPPKPPGGKLKRPAGHYAERHSR